MATEESGKGKVVKDVKKPVNKGGESKKAQVKGNNNSNRFEIFNDHN